MSADHDGSDKRANTETRWSIGDYYLDCPHPGRGGAWYACRYDAGARTVRRKSLRTADFELAKKALVSLTAVAPIRIEDAPHPQAVLTSAVISSYLKGRATQIRSEDYAVRVSTLVAQYLAVKGLSAAPVAAWTPSRQLDFGRWLNATHGHAASTIKRSFSVMGAAFADAARVKIRKDPLGREVEGSLISHAPSFLWTEEQLRKELRMTATARPTFVPTLDEMARFIDALETEHFKRWALWR